MQTTRVFAALSLLTLAACPRQVVELNSLSLTPESGHVVRGETLQYAVTALYSNGEGRDVTAEAVWSIDDAFLGEVNEAGLVHGLREGQTVVRVRFGEKMMTRPLTVTGPVLRTLEIDPPHAIIPVGLSTALVVTGIDSDGAKRDVTAEAAWSTPASSVVAIEGARLVGRSPGTTTVTASVQGLLVTVPVDVSGARVEQVDVQPGALSLPLGLSSHLTATALLSDGTSLDVTSQATWRSSTAAVFASQLPTEAGTIVARGEGAARVTATVLGKTGGSDVTVSSAQLVSLELSPPASSLAAGTTQRFVLTGVFTDGARLDLSGQATWASSNPAVLAVDAAGLARALSPGQATLTAGFGGQTLSRALSVAAATLTALELTPPAPSVARGLTLDLSAWGLFSDGSRQDLTTLAVWRVGDVTVASVSNAVASSGRVTGVAEGQTTVSATFGTTSTTAQLTVSAAALVSLQLSPTAPSMPRGTHQAFTATGLFSDGTSRDLTAQATWTSSAPTCVSVSSQGASRGDAAALSLGQATLTATLGGRSASTLVTVTDAVLERLDVSPPRSSLPLGTSADFTATGVYSDGSSLDLTTQATWTSSDATVAAISNAPGTQGRGHALSLGEVSFVARIGAVSGEAQIVVTPATVARLELSPTSATLAVGLTRDFVVTASFSDGTTLDVTDQAAFSVEDPARAAVSNTPGSRGHVTALGAGATQLVARLMSLEARADLVVTPATAVGLAISPPTLTLALGTTAPLRAEAAFSDGSMADVTAQVSWTSTAPASVAVSNAAGSSGVVSALAVGAAVIHAQLGSFIASADVTASPATLASLELAPTNPTVPLGASQQLTATGRFSDGSAQDLTTLVTWTSALPAVVSLSNAPGTQGRLTAVARGAASVTATFAGVTGSTMVTVSGATLARVEFSPLVPRLAKNTTLQLHATGVWTDGATQDLTESCSWSSLAPAVVTVSNSAGSRGRVDGLAPGLGTVSASCQGTPGTVDVTVTDTTLTAIQLAPTSPGAAAGFSQRLSATGVFSDGSTQPFTELVAWASSDLARATVSNVVGSEGLVLARAQGVVTISATALGVTGTTSFTVSAAVLQTLELTPATAAAPKGLGQAFVALGHFSDGSTAPLTESATWTSATPAVATVSNAAGARGQATALLEGTTQVSATVGGVTGTATLTVTAAALTSLAVTPVMPSVPKGLTRQFTATGTFTDGTTRDLTSTVTWAVVDGSVARISNADGTRGLAQSLSVGTTLISATSGALGATTMLTVTAAELVSLELTPANPSVPRGLALQLTATGVYTDATTRDLTDQVTWASSDAAKLSVSNAAGTNGRAQALAVGLVQVSATFGALTGVLPVTVTAAVLQRIELTPPTPSVAAGLSTHLTATGVYSDATTGDLTATVAWNSGDVMIAAVAGGVVTGVRVGSTSISASQGAVIGVVTIDVTAAVLQQLQVTPQNTSRPKGLSQQFVATGVFSDATTADLTDTVTWASTDPTRVSISNGASRGLASTLAVGNVTISATSGAVSGSTPFTVTAAQMTSLVVMPGGGTAPLGSARQYTATGVFTDGSTQPLTTLATWASSAPAVATISNAVGSQGLATTLATGATVISATYGGFTRTSNLAVIQTTLTRIDISPDLGSTALGYTRQLIALGTYNDGTTQVITEAVTWSSTDTNVALISNAAGFRGLLSTVAIGTVGVTATLGSVSGSTTHTVTPAVLVFLSLSPASLSLAPTGTAQVTATGLFSDGSAQDLTSSVTWTSSAPAVAQVSNAAGSEGLVTGIAAGNASISAQLGAVSASLNVVVN